MASRLTGLLHTLTWRAFPHRHGAGPANGQVANLAETRTNTSYGGEAFTPIPHTRPAQFKLADRFRVTVAFARHGSWVLNWVFTQSQTIQDDLLHHEQGHYNISALIARDFFVDVMLLKDTVFATRQEGIDAVDAIKAASLDKNQAVQELYDTEVHPDQERGDSNGPNQQAWDLMLNSAFNDARSPATTAPDGTDHKVRLLDVLTQNGKSV